MLPALTAEKLEKICQILQSGKIDEETDEYLWRLLCQHPDEYTCIFISRFPDHPGAWNKPFCSLMADWLRIVERLERMKHDAH